MEAKEAIVRAEEACKMLERELGVSYKFRWHGSYPGEVRCEISFNKNKKKVKFLVSIDREGEKAGLTNIYLVEDRNSTSNVGANLTTFDLKTKIAEHMRPFLLVL